MKKLASNILFSVSLFYDIPTLKLLNNSYYDTVKLEVVNVNTKEKLIGYVQSASIKNNIMYIEYTPDKIFSSKFEYVAQ